MSSLNIYYIFTHTEMSMEGSKTYDRSMTNKIYSRLFHGLNMHHLNTMPISLKSIKLNLLSKYGPCMPNKEFVLQGVWWNLEDKLEQPLYL